MTQSMHPDDGLCLVRQPGQYHEIVDVRWADALLAGQILDLDSFAFGIQPGLSLGEVRGLSYLQALEFGENFF